MRITGQANRVRRVSTLLSHSACVISVSRNACDGRRRTDAGWRVLWQGERGEACGRGVGRLALLDQFVRARDDAPAFWLDAVALLWIDHLCIAAVRAHPERRRTGLALLWAADFLSPPQAREKSYFCRILPIILISLVGAAGLEPATR
jgi:hypothetical protein